MALNLEADNCTFEGAKAARGGVFFFSNQRGNDYYVYTPGKVQAIELKNCTIRNCEADQGAVMYFHYVEGEEETPLPAEIPTLILENTTIDGCKTSSEAFWLDVSVTTTFTFENSTISNMGTGETLGSIRLSVPSSSVEDGVVFSGCKFLNTNTPGFIIQFAGTAPKSLKLDECRLVGVTVTKPLNLLQGESGVSFTFTNCWLERVTRGSGDLLSLGEGDASEITGCRFNSCTGSFNFGYAWTVNMARCEIRKMSGGIKGGPNVVTLEDVKILEPTSTLSLSLTVGETFSAKLCELANVALRVTNCRTAIMENVTMVGGSGSLTLYGDGAASTIKYSDFSIGLTLSGAAVFTFEDCCFAKGTTHYITKGGQDASTLKFVPPLCFDKAKEDAINGWETVEGLEDNMFGECECDVIPPEPQDSVTSDEEEPDPDSHSSEEASEEDTTTEEDTPTDEEEGPGGGGDGKSGNKGLPPGAVAGIVVAVIVVVVVVIVLVVLFVLRRRKTDDTDASENEIGDDETINTVTSMELDACVTDEPGTTSPMFTPAHGEDEFGSVFEEATLY